MYSRELKPGMDRLVNGGAFSFGSFSAAFSHANILDVHRPYHYPLPRLVKYFRVNEAQTFQVRGPDVFMYADLYNAKLFTLIYLNVYDLAERKRYFYWRFMIGPRLSIPDSLMDSETAYNDPNFKIRVRSALSEGKIRFRGSAKRYRRRPDLRWDIEFDHSPQTVSPVVSSIPFGLNRAVYSYKAPAPGSGFIAVGEKLFRLVPEDTVGLFGDMKGFYPYISTMDWVAGMGRDAEGRRIAFNLLDNHLPNQDAYNENGLWIDGKLLPLPTIKITRPKGPQGEWIIQDMEGMVDLSFTPEVDNSMHINALFAESDYHGPFGTFRGCLMGPDGEKIRVDGLYGMGKKKRMRT